MPEGFEMCTRLMLPGEIASVTCPPDYAYNKFPRFILPPQCSCIDQTESFNAMHGLIPCIYLYFVDLKYEQASRSS